MSRWQELQQGHFVAGGWNVIYSLLGLLGVAQGSSDSLPVISEVPSFVKGCSAHERIGSVKLQKEWYRSFLVPSHLLRPDWYGILSVGILIQPVEVWNGLYVPSGLIHDTTGYFDMIVVNALKSKCYCASIFFRICIRNLCCILINVICCFKVGITFLKFKYTINSYHSLSLFNTIWTYFHPPWPVVPPLML